MIGSLSFRLIDVKLTEIVLRISLLLRIPTKSKPIIEPISRKSNFSELLFYSQICITFSGRKQMFLRFVTTFEPGLKFKNSFSSRIS